MSTPFPLSVPGQTPGAVLRVGAPDVPSGTDLVHNAQDKINYGEWIRARALEFDTVFAAIPGVNLPALMGEGTPQDGVTALVQLSQSPSPAAQLVGDWIAFRHQWDAFYSTLQGSVGWNSAARDAALNIITAGLWGLGSGAQALSGSDTWSQEKAWHGRLLEWSVRMKAAGLTPPPMPGVPTGHSAGGPSPQTIAIFAGGVALLGAFVGWEIAPLPDKPMAAVALAVVGAGITWYALR